jgi:hypothetical protein
MPLNQSHFVSFAQSVGVRFFDKLEDTPVLSGWCTKRGITLPPDNFLSPTGFTVPGKACLFLYWASGQKAFIDDCYCNPDMLKADKTTAITACFLAALIWANQSGVKYIHGWMPNPKVIQEMNTVLQKTGLGELNIIADSPQTAFQIKVTGV